MICAIITTAAVASAARQIFHQLVRLSVRLLLSCAFFSVNASSSKGSHPLSSSSSIVVGRRVGNFLHVRAHIFSKHPRVFVYYYSLRRRTITTTITTITTTTPTATLFLIWCARTKSNTCPIRPNLPPNCTPFAANSHPVRPHPTFSAWFPSTAFVKLCATFLAKRLNLDR